MWVYVKKGHKKVFRKDFGDDLASATDLYLRAHDAGKPAATLACVNMGFPPPKHLREHTIKKRGRSKRTRKIVTVEVNIQPLKELNLQGKLWCPYCRTLRPFILRKTYKLHGMPVHDPRYVCPICGISHRDHHVRYWNPHAALHMGSALSAHTRRSTKTPRRRRRR